MTEAGWSIGRGSHHPRPQTPLDGRDAANRMVEPKLLRQRVDLRAHGVVPTRP
jgi:hypothetical protein